MSLYHCRRKKSATVKALNRKRKYKLSKQRRNVDGENDKNAREIQPTTLGSPQQQSVDYAKFIPSLTADWSMNLAPDHNHVIKKEPPCVTTGLPQQQSIDGTLSIPSVNHADGNMNSQLDHNSVMTQPGHNNVTTQPDHNYVMSQVSQKLLEKFPTLGLDMLTYISPKTPGYVQVQQQPANYIQSIPSVITDAPQKRTGSESSSPKPNSDWLSTTPSRTYQYTPNTRRAQQNSRLHLSNHERITMNKSTPLHRDQPHQGRSLLRNKQQSTSKTHHNLIPDNHSNWYPNDNVSLYAPQADQQTPYAQLNAYSLSKRLDTTAQSKFEENYTHKTMHSRSNVLFNYHPLTTQSTTSINKNRSHLTEQPNAIPTSNYQLHNMHAQTEENPLFIPALNLPEEDGRPYTFEMPLVHDSAVAQFKPPALILPDEDAGTYTFEMPPVVDSDVARVQAPALNLPDEDAGSRVLARISKTPVQKSNSKNSAHPYLATQPFQILIPTTFHSLLSQKGQFTLEPLS